MCARVESCGETRTHTHLHTTATHTHTHSHRHTPLFLHFVHYNRVLPDSFFRLLHHCIPQSLLFVFHLFLYLFTTFVISYILIPFYNIYLFIPIRKKKSKNSKVITITSTCIIARDRGLRRECRDGHGTITPAAEIAAVIEDLTPPLGGGLFYTFNCSALKDEVSLRAKNISR